MTQEQVMAAWRSEVAAAQAALMAQGSIKSAFTIIAANGARHPVSGSWGDDSDKDAVLRLVGLVAVAEAAVAILWCAEAWMVLGNPNLDLAPSESERRQEVLLSAIAFRSPDTGEKLHYVSIRHIARDIGGAVSGVSDVDLPPGVEAEGHLAGLLPAEPPTLAERRHAREQIQRATKRIDRGRPPFVH
jgi:hypothetical protein